MGSIPAWAGEPAAELPRRGRRWVYPRVGGGTHAPSQSGQNSKGLSPRGRGNLDLSQLNTSLPGSIPAWAGEPTSVQVLPPIVRRSIPAWAGAQNIKGLSPRGRGNAGVESNPRSIPNVGPCRPKTDLDGLSPRGRGNRNSACWTTVYPRVHQVTYSGSRSIPAWAGEPTVRALHHWHHAISVYPRVGGGTGIAHRPQWFNGSCR